MDTSFGDERCLVEAWSPQLFLDFLDISEHLKTLLLTQKLLAKGKLVFSNGVPLGTQTTLKGQPSSRRPTENKLNG